MQCVSSTLLSFGGWIRHSSIGGEEGNPITLHERGTDGAAVGCSVWRRRVMAPFFIVAGKVESAAEAATYDDMYDAGPRGRERGREGGRPTDDPREHHRINILFAAFVTASKRTSQTCTTATVQGSAKP